PVTTQGDPALAQTNPFDPTIEPGAEPATEPTAEPATEPAIEPNAKPGVKPATQPAETQPVQRPARRTPAATGVVAGGMDRLIGALTALRDTLAEVRYPLALPDSAEAASAAAAIIRQIDDYLLPRLGRLDAPLLVVVGGSTGAGKSTLVNSLVRAPVS